MKNELEVRELLARELRPLAAPEGLWERIQPALDRAPRKPSSTRWFEPALIAVFGVLLILLLLPVRWLPHANPLRRTLDLQSYLAPVQSASEAASAPAISRSLANFRNVQDAEGIVSLAGYDLTAERVARIDGEPVKQVIFTGTENAVALFIASPKVKLDAGVNRWVESSVDGVACKRLNCPRVRTVQFPCSKQTCVLVCKTCSEQSMVALMTQVAARTPEFR